jgi:hypothetical protein
LGCGQLEDRLAISDLFVRYVGALDVGDVETVVAASRRPWSARRRQPHRACRDPVFAERLLGFAKGVQLRHMISNLAVRSTAMARATCSLIVFVTRDGKTGAGRYE